MLIVLPKMGLVEAPELAAMVTYLIMWGLFTAVLFIGTLRFNRALQVVFASLTLLFFLTVTIKSEFVIPYPPYPSYLKS